MKLLHRLGLHWMEAEPLPPMPDLTVDRQHLCHAPNPLWLSHASQCARKAGHKGAHRADDFHWSPDGRPRLVVARLSRHLWYYQLVDHEGAGPARWAPTQPAALALGLAALDTTRSHR